MDLHTGNEWLIHATKSRKGNHLQTQNSPVEQPRRKCKRDLKESEDDTCNPIFKEYVQQICAFSEPDLLIEKYIWNQAAKNSSIISLLVCICLLERAYVDNLLEYSYNIW